jgi:hypothetical protein
MSRSCRAPLPIRALAGLLVAGSLFGGSVPVQAKGCAEGSPAELVPPALWDDLQPERILIDATKWTGSQRPTMAYQISTSVDIENGFVFSSFYGGFSIWDARTNPGNPQRLGIIGGYEGMFPSWPSLTEFTQIVFYIDAPAGDDSIAAVAAITPVGLSIWDTSDKSTPRPLYQDTGKFMYQVYTARIAGRDWAFGADFQSGTGLHLYDMTAARSFNRCVEDRTAGQNNCPGVWKRRIGAQEATKYVHGLAIKTGNTDRHFIVKSGGYLGARGVQIWEVTTPTDPRLVVEEYRTTTGGNGYIHGVAMWTQGNRHYLAMRQAGDAKIFDITNCLEQGCQNISSSLVWQKALKPYPESLYWLSTTFSRSGDTPFLYFGNHETCRQDKPAGQTEYLYDVSNAAAPGEVMPDGTIQQGGETVDYWSWYYSTYNKGYSHFGPRVAKFHGSYLYRAGATIFDIHRWTGASPPVADFSFSPAEVWAGDPVTFTSTGIGTVTAYAWTFQDGVPAATGAAAGVCAPAVSGFQGRGGPACPSGPR